MLKKQNNVYCNFVLKMLCIDKSAVFLLQRLPDYITMIDKLLFPVQIGTDFLEEAITAFEDLVQSVDVAAFNKV